MNISVIIGELLLRNGKLVIPDFGTFLIKRKPAEFNKNTRVLTPPSTEVTLDIKNYTDDGILSGHVRKKFNMKEQEAADAIKDMVESFKKQIAAEGTLLIPELGKIIRGKDGSILVESSKEFIDKVNMVELPQFNIPDKRTKTAAASTSGRTTGTMKATTTGKGIPDTRKSTSGTTVTQTKKRRWWVPVTIIIILAALVAGAYVTGYYERIPGWDKISKVFQKKSGESETLVFGKANTAEQDSASQNISEEIDERTSRERALAYEQEEMAVTEDEGTIQRDISSSAIPDDGKPYHVIAGSFLVPNNAELKKETLEEKGFPAVLLPPRGDYYMVSVGSYTTMNEAVAGMRTLKEKLKQDLWVMKL